MSANAPAAQDKPEIFPQLGHSGDVYAVAFSRDSKHLFSGSGDGTIKVWDIASGREIRTLRGHTSAVTAIALSADGKVLASASNDKTIKFWDLTRARELKNIKSTLYTFNSVQFSRDGRTLVVSGNPILPSGGIATVIQRWDIASGRRIAGSPGQFISVAISPDGRLACTSGFSSPAATLWNGAREHRLPLSGGSECAGFSRDGKILLLSNRGRWVFWDTAAGHVLSAITPSNTGSPFELSPDAKVLTTQSDGHNSIALADAATGRVLRTLSADSDFGNAHFDCATFSADGKLVAAGNSDGTITIWDAASGQRLETLSRRASFVRSIALSPDGRTLGVAREDGVSLWETSSGHELRRLDDRNDTRSLAFTSDNNSLISMAYPGIEFWNLANGTKTQTIEGDYEDTIAFAPSGPLFATFGARGHVLLLDAASGSQIRDLNIGADIGPPLNLAVTYIGGRAGPGSSCDPLAFSSDGKTLAIAGYYKFVGLWDVASGRELRRFSGSFDSACSVALSSDGKFLAAGTSKGTQVWGVASGHEPRALRDSSTRSFAVFSPNGQLIASGSKDDTIGLWDSATGNLLRILTGHSSLVTSATFSSDGMTLFSGSNDGTVRIWDVSTGKNRASLIAFDNGSSIAVTPEGFFDSSSEPAEENLNVRIGNRVFGIASFRENFYRPDLVEKALAGKDISKEGSIDRVKLSPEVEFAGLPSSTSDPNLKIALNLTNGGGGFGPVRVFWNGTVIQQDNNLPTGGVTLRRSYAVPLLDGDNAVRATAFNADSSMWSEASVAVSAALPVKKLAGAHGTLHAVVVGVQEFPNAPEHNLKYAFADATLIAKTLTDKAAPLFDNKPDVQLMATAAQTDKDDLVKALQAVAASSGPDDEFVLYVSSHGIVGDDGQYYVATSNLDPANRSGLKAQAISAKELGNLIANIRAGRKLVVLDTCDAGAAAAALNESQLAQRTATVFARGYGFTVLAAANSNQDALEGGIDGHGLFTYVVNDGLSGKAADASGIVSSFLLADYVNKHVPDVAQNVLHRKQDPMAQKSGETFPVTKVK